MAKKLIAYYKGTGIKIVKEFYKSHEALVNNGITNIGLVIFYISKFV